MYIWGTLRPIDRARTRGEENGSASWTEAGMTAGLG